MGSETSSDLQNVISAKNEYLMSLHKIISPFVIKFLKDTYAEAVQKVGARNSFREFQTKLQEIRSWNADVIGAHAREIEQKHPVLTKLLAAAFVSLVKILSSIRISSVRPKIKLTIPANDRFIHRVFKLTAKYMYTHPYAVRDADNDELEEVISKAVENAVRDMIPMNDVLSAYLSTTVDQESGVDPVLSPDVSDKEENDLVMSDQDDEEADEPKVIEYATQPPVVTEYPPATFAPPPVTEFTPPQMPQPPAPQAPQVSYQPPPQFQPPQAAAQNPLFPEAGEGDEHFR